MVFPRNSAVLKIPSATAAAAGWNLRCTVQLSPASSVVRTEDCSRLQTVPFGKNGAALVRLGPRNLQEQCRFGNIVVFIYAEIAPTVFRRLCMGFDVELVLLGSGIHLTHIKDESMIMR